MAYLEDDNPGSDPVHNTGTTKPPPTDEFGLSEPGGSSNM
jgi:hypothetical protein